MRTSRRGSLVKEKTKSLSNLKIITADLKKRGKRIVFTNGCFDILHYGHAQYLQEAKNKGDILIIGLNSDSSVRKIKGDKRPIVTEKNRLGLLASLESVDYVVKFNETTPIKLIKALKPDILVKGADWSKDKIVGGDFVCGYGGKVLTIKLVKGLSTTDLIQKIAKTS
ncbi:MAG: D-glycero-beta-D-manno-heptose 1-phosphate adenylyltransferase [Candidatus Omnitrophica bacterium]|nr:D-glycero-beta-D-manno-heptose 1-phosphate adenylyltransferase [Candidatus Omnitrophota bacterium]MBU1870373.1 D-glycero-beta-D-manno-heptose 1-phosphate adenylyltransferase [Candidatus Omnitrophota bacterium]